MADEPKKKGGRPGNEQMYKRQKYEVKLIENNHKLTLKSFEDDIITNFGVGKQTIKKDIDKLEIYVNPATGFMYRDENQQKKIRGRLAGILKKELLSIIVAKKSAEISIYRGTDKKDADILMKDASIDKTLEGDLEESIEVDEAIHSDKSQADYMISILLELVDTGFESVIANMLYSLYSDRIYMVNTGVGGLVIYPHNNKETEVILKYLRRHI